MMKINVLAISIMIFLSMTVIVDAGTNITYKSYIDNSYGFYKVRDITTQKPVLYENRTLTINQGDAVIWISDIDNKTMTIINEQGLWDDGDVYLVESGQYKYRFKIPGEYSFYIKEFPSVRQRIVVNGTDPVIPTIIPTEIMTPTPTETPIPIPTATPVETVHETPNIPKNISNDTLNSTLNTTSNKDSSSGDRKINARSIILIILGIFIVARRVLL